MRKGEDEQIVTTEEKKTTGTGMVTLVYTKNQTFELHVGGTMYRFTGQNPVAVPRSVLSHPDWTDEISKLFVVKE